MLWHDQVKINRIPIHSNIGYYSVCLHVSMWGYTGACSHAYMRVNMLWRSEDNLRYCLSDTVHLVFQANSLAGLELAG